ncbi:MAG: polysaccharide biosynthesis C-terminal domain-containing protein [Lentimicrobium sp.]|nr:polysaccharide biosynthesis C-terminal domain-containing protein [Lentimicrobium sp.]
MSTVNIKEHLKLSLIYTAVAAVPPVLQVLIQPIIEGSNRLNATDFAQIGMAEMVTSLAFTVSLFSMGNALSRFFYDVNDDRKAYNSMVSSVFSSIIFRGFLLLILAFVFRNHIGNLFSQENLRNFSVYGFAAIITGINRSINISAATLYRNEKRVRAFIIVNLATAIVRTAFQLIGLFYYEMSFLGYVYGSAVGSSIVALGVLAYSYRTSGFRYDRVLLGSMNRFAWPLFQYGVLTWGLTFADKYFMERFPADLGIYFTAVNFALGMQIIMQGMQGATQPEIFRYMKEGIAKREDDIRSLSNMLMAQSQAIIAIAILPVMLYLTLFYETDVKLASAFIALIFIRYIPRTQYIIFSFVVYYQKKTQFFLYLNLVTLTVNIILNLLLIPHFFIYGAVISIMVSDILQVLGAYFYSRKISPIRWNLSKLLYSPLICVTLVIIFEIIKETFSLNIYISASASVIVLITSLLILYRRDISGFLKRI